MAVVLPGRATARPDALGVWMQLLSMGVISFRTLSRIMGKIFCTKASSCCLKSSAGYLASTCLKPPEEEHGPGWLSKSNALTAVGVHNRGRAEGKAELRENVVERRAIKVD